MLQREHADGTTTLTLARAERGHALAPAPVEALIEAIDAACADSGTARAPRAATRSDHRGADLANLVRLAAEPGLRARVAACRRRMAGRT